VVAGIIFSIGSATAGDAVDLRILPCGLLITVGHLAAVLGTRMRGRFTVHALALAPARLPRTILSIAPALAIAPVSPALERVGAWFVYGPVTATYGWLGDIGLPTWAAIIAIVPVAPLEVVAMVLIANVLIVIPAAPSSGANGAVTKALEGSFGSIKVDDRQDLFVSGAVGNVPDHRTTLRSMRRPFSLA
jgi:hypothetical protein